MPDNQAELGSLARWIGGHRGELIGTAYSVLRDRDMAEDVVQDTLLRVWKLSGGQKIERGPAYLHRAVYWNALKHRARRTREISPDPPRTAIPQFDRDDGSWTLSALELERAIGDLPPAQQAVVRLRFVLGLSFQEIGRALAISANTAASRCRYALSRLRRSLSAGKANTEMEGRKR